MILLGDATTWLRRLPDNLVQCCVTSPPYWQLRNYSIAGQLGQEPTINEYIGAMTSIFIQVLRVLRPDGTLWLNIGDSYINNSRGQHKPGDKGKQNYVITHGGGQTTNTGNCKLSGLRPKNLCMIPARLVLALQASGWNVRSEVIWQKPNALPEPTKDRPTKSHEMLYLLAKSRRYYYNASLVAEPARTGAGLRNLRSVWSIPTQPLAEEHFAAFPQRLVETCLLASTKPGDLVLDPFLGSGTTAIVAEYLSRKWIGIELNPKYVEIAKQRISSYF